MNAVVFGRSCGATTGVSTQVSILAAGEGLPNEGGNICGVGGFPQVELRWAGINELVVAHHGGAKLFNAVQSFEGVNIRYEVLGHAASNNGMQRTRSQQVSYP